MPIVTYAAHTILHDSQIRRQSATGGTAYKTTVQYSQYKERSGRPSTKHSTFAGPKQRKLNCTTRNTIGQPLQSVWQNTTYISSNTMARHRLAHHKQKRKTKPYGAARYTNPLFSVRRYVDLGICSDSKKHNMSFWKQSGREQMLPVYISHTSMEPLRNDQTQLLLLGSPKKKTCCPDELQPSGQEQMLPVYISRTSTQPLRNDQTQLLLPGSPKKKTCCPDELQPSVMLQSNVP